MMMEFTFGKEGFEKLPTLIPSSDSTSRLGRTWIMACEYLVPILTTLLLYPETYAASEAVWPQLRM